MGRIVASDLYPAVRKFLPENELARTLKAFQKETAEEEVGGTKKKKARILKDLDLVEAGQLWYNERGNTTVSAANLYPAFRRFLSETGLERTLKALGKEVEEEENGGAKPKKAKLLAELELTEACQLWYDAKVAEAAEEAPAEEAVAAKSPKLAAKGSPKLTPKSSPKLTPKSPKLKCVGDVCVREVGEADEGTKKRKKAPVAEEPEPEAEAAEAGAEEAEEAPKKKRKKEERKQGVPFQREDWSKWSRSLSDERLKDNTHKAKMAFGDGAGDSWGDKAAEDLLKVKGKGFRKEMAKKKRASWRGGGELDMGVNSIKFEDSDDE